MCKEKKLNHYCMALNKKHVLINTKSYVFYNFSAERGPDNSCKYITETSFYNTTEHDCQLSSLCIY